MCDNPGFEFHIVASVTCDPDITRRQFEESGVQNETKIRVTDASGTDVPETDTPVTDVSTTGIPATDVTATEIEAETTATDDPEAETTLSHDSATNDPTADDSATDDPTTDVPESETTTTDVSVTDDPTAEVNATESPVVEDYTTASEYGNTTKPGLRAINVSEYDTAWCPDRHPCAPLSCPNVYRPVCMNINHKFSQNPKIYTFVNHCVMDRYYCTHYKEFEVPEKLPGPRAVVSFLDWSYCSAQRYLKFLFTARAASSMGHYGWLHGDDRYSKILEPWERQAGYG